MFTEKVDLSEETKKAIESFQYYSFAFAKDSNFETEKTACYMSIIQETLLHDIDEKMESLESSMKYVKDLILRHSTERPPISVIAHKNTHQFTHIYINTITHRIYK